MLLALLLAQAAPAACPVPAKLPADYAGWTAGGAVGAGADAAGAPALTVGRGVKAALTPGFKPPIAVKKPAANGGLLAFQVAAAGRYRVALGAGVWVEVIARGAAVPSVAHGHGPECTPVRKFVEWNLLPGRHLLQLTGDAAAVQVEVLRVS